MSSDTTNQGIFNNTYYNVFNETVDPELKVEDLLEKEEARLRNKKKVIDPLYNTKLRKDGQIRSMTLRTNAYNYMILVIAVAVGMVVSLFIIKNNFPFPEWLMTILLMLIISGSIIYVLILYTDILKRDTSDFEKVDFGLLVDVDKVKANGKGDLTGVVLGDEKSVNCVGSKCCPDDSFFWGNKCNTTAESFSTRSNLSASFLSFSPKPLFTSV